MNKPHLKVFSDLNPIPIKYSKYAVSLDKVFKNQSLESLHYNLKHPKAFKIKDFNFDKGEPPQQNNLYNLSYLISSAEKFNILPDIKSHGRNSRNEQHLGNFQSIFLILFLILLRE